MFVDEVELAFAFVGQRVSAEERGGGIWLDFSIAIKLLNSFVVDNVCFLFRPLLLIGLNLVVKVAHVHFFY